MVTGRRGRSAGGCPPPGLQSRCGRRWRGSGMDSRLRLYRCRAKVARRAGLLAVSLAVAAFMALPTAAFGLVEVTLSRDVTAGTGGLSAVATPTCGNGCFGDLRYP